ncbi:hypothetical protein [Niveibacterium umoris]|uniref:Uncharacterized protein n=1 Tax=Niveibacterium umoris TaxID=1193620 RepID=A0A840BTJ8_9RHOO|nr:hypothetical protein [Niveibacterium umoris]MBB4014136.1 hypothetical protein [Niveibacterium umoris]
MIDTRSQGVVTSREPRHVAWREGVLPSSGGAWFLTLKAPSVRIVGNGFDMQAGVSIDAPKGDCFTTVVVETGF